jgi:hypothetical protein
MPPGVNSTKNTAEEKGKQMILLINEATAVVLSSMTYTSHNILRQHRKEQCTSSEHDCDSTTTTTTHEQLEAA